jgi:hypothetical protein
MIPTYLKILNFLYSRQGALPMQPYIIACKGYAAIDLFFKKI